MTQSSGGTVKAPRLRRLSDQTALMVKGTSPELWMVLSFKDSINWLRNVLYGDMLYYRILWGNAIQEIWCPVELVRRHARGASPTKLRFSAIATDRRGILPSVRLQTPARPRKGLVCIRDFFIGQTWVGRFFCYFLLFNSPLPLLCGLASARSTSGVWRHDNTCKMWFVCKIQFSVHG